MIHKNNQSLIYYDVIGPEKAPLVALTHGIAMDHTAFVDQVDALKHKYRVLVWDLPGHGFSFPMKARFSYQLAMESLLGILDELYVAQVITVGVSLGGQINQYLADHYPKRVRDLVECGSLAFHKGFGPLTKGLGSAFVWMSKLIPENQVYSSFAKSTGISQKTRDYVRYQAENLGKNQFLNIMQAMIEDMAKGIPKPVEQPLLILHEKHESTFVASHLQRWHEALAYSSYSVVPAAGHIANMDNPDDLNRSVLEYLELILA